MARGIGHKISGSSDQHPTSYIETKTLSSRHLRPSIRSTNLLHVPSQHRAILPACQSSFGPRMRVRSLPGSTTSIDSPNPSWQWSDEIYDLFKASCSGQFEPKIRGCCLRKHKKMIYLPPSISSHAKLDDHQTTSEKPALSVTYFRIVWMCYVSMRLLALPTS